MDISGSTALVTGANRGIGRAFVTELQARGARRIYAAARDPHAIDVPGVEVLALDITDPAAVTRAAQAAPDVTLLINNAGISAYQDLVGGDLELIRRELETNVFGTLAMVRAFAPVLAAQGGGAVLNVLSALSWRTFPGAGSYGVSKAAEWSLTDGIRLELAAQGTLVTGLHMGAVDTDMMAGWDIPKLTPADVVGQALDGIAAGRTEVIADETARSSKASLADDPEQRYADFMVTAA
jgi:NAD(P)-dependent dehydrogenase (short-subunit alcohol dehydrogenase family)